MIQIDNKFDVGETVWFIEEKTNKIKSNRIYHIGIDIHEGETEITYDSDVPGPHLCHDEGEVFAIKEEAEKYLKEERKKGQYLK